MHVALCFGSRHRRRDSLAAFHKFRHGSVRRAQPWISLASRRRGRRDRRQSRQDHKAASTGSRTGVRRNRRGLCHARSRFSNRPAQSFSGKTALYEVPASRVLGDRRAGRSGGCARAGAADRSECKFALHSAAPWRNRFRFRWRAHGQSRDSARGRQRSRHLQPLGRPWHRHAGRRRRRNDGAVEAAQSRRCGTLPQTEFAVSPGNRRQGGRVHRAGRRVRRRSAPTDLCRKRRQRPAGDAACRFVGRCRRCRRCREGRGFAPRPVCAGRAWRGA